MKKLFSILFITSLVFLAGSMHGMKRTMDDLDRNITQQTHYNILSVPHNATTEEITKAYKDLALLYHPDKNHGKEKWAEREFKKIVSAYEVLNDDYTRLRYDNWLDCGDAIPFDSYIRFDNNLFTPTYNIKKCYACPNLISGSTGFSLSPCCSTQKISLCATCCTQLYIECFLCRKQIEVGHKNGFIHLSIAHPIQEVDKQSRKKVKKEVVEVITLPLQKASIQGKFREVEHLLSNNNAIINQVDSVGKSALHYASEFGRLSIITLLRKHGADVLLQDNMGKTALHYACANGFPTIVELLLKYGVNINARDSGEKTPLFYAWRYAEIKEKLLSWGAQV